jgi:hypothetical protein
MSDTTKTASDDGPAPTDVEIMRSKLGKRGKQPIPTSKTSKKLSLRTRENLTPRMKAIRDRFITEYIRDWCGPSAYIRAGGPSTSATKMATEFLREPYVVQRLTEIIDAMEEEKLLDNKIILMGLIKEARYQGIGASHGARVAAWKSLADIKGIANKISVKSEVTHRGGVMVVPVIPGSDTWEQLAANSQKQLKDDVRK